MPTIIESLVTELSIDPSGMDRGARQADAHLRNLEQSARRVNQSIGDGTNRTLRDYMQSYDQHLSGISKKLDDLGAQSRRAGQSIASGAAAGAVGLRDLAAAGLEAFAAFEALKGLYREVTSTAAGATAMGRTLPEIGGSSRWAQQFANAAGVSVGANPASIQNELRSLEVDLSQYRLGLGMSDRLQKMIMGGVNLNQSDTIETLLGKLEGNLGGLSTTDAVARAESYGLSSDLGRFARQGPGGVGQVMARVQNRNLTDDQIKAMTRLTQAETDAAQAWTHLWQVMTADFSESGLSSVLEGLANFFDALSKNKDELHAVELGVAAVAAVSVGGVINGLAGLVSVLLRFSGVGAIFRGVAAGVAELRVALLALVASPVLAPVMAFLYAFRPYAAGNQAEVSAEQGIARENMRRAGIGGGGGGGGVAGSNDYSGAGSEFLRNQRARMASEIASTPGLQDKVLAMASLEDARDPAGPIESLFNRAAYTGKSINELLSGRFYSTRDRFPGAIANMSAAQRARMQAGLDFVIRGSNRLKGATDQGQTGDPNAPGSPGGTTSGLIFPPGATPGAIYNDFGGGPGGHAGAAAFRIAQQARVAGGGTDSGISAVDEDAFQAKLWAQQDANDRIAQQARVAGGGTDSGISAVDEDAFQAKLWAQQDANDFVRSHQASGGGTVVNNDVDHTVNVGTVNVHTQATDATGIAGSLHGAIVATAKIPPQMVSGQTQ